MELRDTLQWEASQSTLDSSLVSAAYGFFLQVSLVGVDVAVYTRYVQRPTWKSDPLWCRILTTFIMVLTLLSAGLNAVAFTRYAVHQERDSNWLESSPTAMRIVAASTWYTVEVSVGAFLAQRAFLFTKRISPWGSVLLLCSLALTFAVSVFAAIYTSVRNGFFSYTSRETANWVDPHGPSIALAAAAARDAIISSTLGWLWFRQLKRNEGFSRHTDTLLRKLIRFTLSTALYTTLPAVFSAVYGFTRRDGQHQPDFGDVGPDLTVPLYPLSLFTTLGYRESLRATRDLEQSTVETFPVANPRPRHPSTSSSSEAPTTAFAGVSVNIPKGVHLSRSAPTAIRDANSL